MTMPNREPSAAQALYGHLKSGTPERRPERNQSVGQTMWPSLGPKDQPKPPTNSSRESLLRGLRELNAKIDARLQREGRR